MNDYTLEMRRKFYGEIRERVSSLEKEIADLRVNHAKSLHEELQGLRPNRDVSQFFERAIKYHENGLDELRRKLPCDLFWNMFGLQLHEAFREKYPINYYTRLFEVSNEAMQEWVFPMIVESKFVFGSEPPTAVNTRHYHVPLKQWSDGYNFVYLGWIDEERIVLVGKRGHYEDFSRMALREGD